MSSTRPSRPSTATLLCAATTSSHARPCRGHQPCPQMGVTGPAGPEHRPVVGVIDRAGEAQTIRQAAAPPQRGLTPRAVVAERLTGMVVAAA
jgi:hypothetical protein